MEVLNHILKTVVDVKSQLLKYVNNLSGKKSVGIGKNSLTSLQKKGKIEETCDIHKLYEELSLLEQFIEDNISMSLESSAGLKLIEDERNRLARELHDSTVQDLTSLIYKTELCSKVIDEDPVKVKLELQIIIQSLKNVIEELRKTIYNLHSINSSEKSLNNLIQEYVETLYMNYPEINIRFDKSGNDNVKCSMHSIGIYRIIQEACQNAIKHANVSNIRVRISYEKYKISVEVSDDGDGFDTKDLGKYINNKRHFGISIMYERTKLLGGKLNISSEIGKGTIVLVEIPK